MTTKCNTNENCSCPNTSCERHGKCCQCINFHRENGTLVCCMKEIANKQ